MRDKPAAAASVGGHTAPTSYRPEIDGLRAVAVLSVVLHHLSPALAPGGYVGVDIFFVISGYLITQIIYREMQEGGFTFARFYERRARRIFPALFAMLLAVFVAAYAMLLPTDTASTLRGTFATLLFSSNILFWRELAAGYFAATDAALNPVLHTWSLAVEEQFYVFFPPLLLLLRAKAPHHVRQWVLAAAVVSFVAACLLLQSKSVAVFFLAPFRAWELFAGALLAIAPSSWCAPVKARELSGSLGLAAILASLALYDVKTSFPGAAAALPVLGTCAVIYANQGGHRTLSGRLLSLRPFVFIGLVSYSLYLWHWPLIVFMRHYATGRSISDYLPALFAASLVLSVLSYKFIEQPFRRRTVSFPRVLGPILALASVVLTIAAVTGLLRAGFENRYSPEIVAFDRARWPTIPYQQCDDWQGGWCQVGVTGSFGSTMLWGDSHLLAWAPAFDSILKEQHQSAQMAVSSACPPIFGLEQERKPVCALHNKRVQEYLQAHPEITTVVLAGYWSTYFNRTSPLSATGNDGRSLRADKAAAAQLESTLDWLGKRGTRVIVLGPVPPHDVNVPFALARGQPDLVRSSAAEQQARHATFLNVIRRAQSARPFVYVDPIGALCHPVCQVAVGDTSLYRDAHHLSVKGALQLRGLIASALQVKPAAPAI